MIQDKIKYIPYIIIIILISILFIQRCDNQDKSILEVPVTVTIPEQSGSFVSPSIFTPLPENKDNVIYKDTIIQESRMNRELVEAFIKTKDSLTKERLYRSAITKRKYSNKFEDDKQIITIDSEVEGNLLSLVPSYKIKEQIIEATVPVKIKQPVLSLYTGLGISNNTSLDNFAVQANLGIQNKKGNIIYGTYDTKGNIGIGYNIRLFQIKK